MPDIAWPQTLPLPTVQGYGVQPGEAILRTEMEAGLARQRRRFSEFHLCYDCISELFDESFFTYFLYMKYSTR